MAEDADIVIVVDVLSFTTTLSVALDAGMAVLPYPWADDSAQRFARDAGATLAVGRSRARPGEISLSPTSVRTATDRPPRLVLPSPNGSALARSFVGRPQRCVAACLRNAPAVGRWLTKRQGPERTCVAVLAAGERWDDGALRPAAEDLWGAGAVIGALTDAGWRSSSPEADVARASYQAIRGRELEALQACASGRELVERGYAADVSIAAETDSSQLVPVLSGASFIPANLE